MRVTTKPSTRTADSIGKILYETKPNIANVIAGFILGLGLVAGGLAITGFMVRQVFLAGGRPPATASDWAGAGGLALMGLAFAAAGVLLILFARSLVGFRLQVCTDGFRFTQANEEKVFAWDEIVQVRECIMVERLPLAKLPPQLLPGKTTRTYTVRRCDGEEFYFDENVLPRTSLLAGPLTTAATARGIEWETTEQRG